MVKNSANHDYISLHDLIGDMAADNDDGEDDDEQGDCVLGPEDVEIFLKNVANCMDQDDVLFRNPKWLENFKEIKRAAIDPLYEGSPKHLMVLHFNLQMLMLKARHRWSDMNFNDLLERLAESYPGLVSTSGLAANSAIACDSYKNPKVGDKRKRLIRGPSCKANICKFITDQYCHVVRQFFYTGSELAREEKFDKLRK